MSPSGVGARGVELFQEALTDPLPWPLGPGGRAATALAEWTVNRSRASCRDNFANIGMNAKRGFC